jgi:hypothetical protein
LFNDPLGELWPDMMGDRKKVGLDDDGRKIRINNNKQLTTFLRK